MRTWLGKVVSLVSGAALVYACAGKSMRTDGDGASGDDGGYVGGGGGNGSGTTGKGGSLGTGGKGGSTGKGGVGGTLGKGGTGGFDAGAAGADDCGPRPTAHASGDCTAPRACISITNPTEGIVHLNQSADTGGQGGAGGEGGSAHDSEVMATATVCDLPEASHGFLAFDYQYPENGFPAPYFYVASDPNACEGNIFGMTRMGIPDPPPGIWTTQCIPVYGLDLGGSVTVGVPVSTPERTSRVRNVRFALGCECSLLFTRFTTCGNVYVHTTCA